MKDLPLYRSHKELNALRIVAIRHMTDGSATIVPEPGFEPFVKDDQWMFKHNPHVGGYWVRYADGYESYSPADVFLAGNDLISHPGNVSDVPHHPV